MSDHDEAGGGAGARSDLRARLGDDFAQRLVSGLAMGAIAALCTVLGMMPFAVLVIVVAMLLSWEWGRLVHGREGDMVIAVHAAAAGGAAVLAAFGKVGLGLLAAADRRNPGDAAEPRPQQPVLGARRVLCRACPPSSLIWLRSDPQLGLLAVVFVIVIVVTTDTAGFLAGRLMGGPKLWPRVSPNKTWAGIVGALAASCDRRRPVLVRRSGAARPCGWRQLGAMLSLVAQAGDLAESAIKRRFGAKDASSLIPGHGGVMDRVDGLVAAASAVGLAAFVINVHSPAHALLLGS